MTECVFDKFLKCRMKMSLSKKEEKRFPNQQLEMGGSLKVIIYALLLVLYNFALECGFREV